MLALLAAACATVTDDQPSDLDGEWVVEDIAGCGVIDNSHATLIFGAGGQFSGRASCNTMSSTYSQHGRAVSIGTVALTRMACPPAILNQEAMLLRQLQGIRTYRIDETGALVLEGENGSYILARKQ